MKNKTALNVAYYIVTNGFTLGLFGLIINLGIAAGDGKLPGLYKDIQINSDKQTRVRKVFEEHGQLIYDTTFYYNGQMENDGLGITHESYAKADWLSVKNVVSIRTDKLKNTHRITDYYLFIRYIFIYMAWLYIAYQVFFFYMI